MAMSALRKGSLDMIFTIEVSIYPKPRPHNLVASVTTKILLAPSRKCGEEKEKQNPDETSFSQRNSALPKREPPEKIDRRALPKTNRAKTKRSPYVQHPMEAQAQPIW